MIMVKLKNYEKMAFILKLEKENPMKS